MKIGKIKINIFNKIKRGLGPFNAVSKRGGVIKACTLTLGSQIH